MSRIRDEKKTPVLGDGGLWFLILYSLPNQSPVHDLSHNAISSILDNQCPLMFLVMSRPAEVVDSKVEATEEDASTSDRIFSVDYDSSTGGRYATPFQWQEKRFGPGGDAASEDYPFRGRFERSAPASPRFLEELVNGVFGGPFDLSEFQRAAPPTTSPGFAEHLTGWFKGGPFGGEGQESSPADVSSSDQSKSKQEVTKLYEALARGVQEV